MKTLFRLVALGFAFIAPQLCLAQAPAGAPAGATGLCNDGTYFTGSVKLGACTGHKGLKTWYGAAKKPTPSSTTTTNPSTTTTSSSAPKTTASTPAAPATPAGSAPKSTTPASTSSTAAAPGGGPGMVWENTGSATKTYHCPGTTYYGKTKTGKYVSESQAKADGYHPNGGKPCSK